MKFFLASSNEAKNICYKILPAHFIITKRGFILYDRCFCEKYSFLLIIQIAYVIVKLAHLYMNSLFIYI